MLSKLGPFYTAASIQQPLRGTHTASAKTESSIVKGLLFLRKLEELKNIN